MPDCDSCEVLETALAAEHDRADRLLTELAEVQAKLEYVRVHLQDGIKVPTAREVVAALSKPEPKRLRARA